MPDLKVVLAGAGYFAGFHLEAWTRIPGAKLIAVCDPDEAKRSEFVSRAPGAAGYATLEAALEAVKPDIVDIATPPHTHEELVVAAGASGALLICQKPVAPTFDEAVAVVDGAKRAGATLVIHENYRFTPWHREMRRVLEAGTLGKLHAMAMRLRPGDGQGADAYLSRQPYFQNMERFLIHETAIHWVDSYRYLAGEVSGVFARLRRGNPVIAGEDAGYVMFEFEGGASGLFDGNRLNDHPSDNTRLTMGEMWLEGSAGVLRLDGYARLFFKPHGEPEREHPYVWENRGFAGDCVHAFQSHVVSHLASGSALENTGTEYLRNLEIEEAIYRSHEQGRWIQV